MNKRIITFREAIEEAFREEFSKNPNRIIIGESVMDVTPRTDVPPRPLEPTLSFLEKMYPNRILNHIPLVEEMLPGIGLGMNIGGLDPVVQFDWGVFITLALDQIYRLGNWRYRMAEKTGPSVILRLGDGGHGLGGAEISALLTALAFHLPNIWIAIPSTPFYAKGLWNAAFNANRPIVFLETKRLYGISGYVPEKNYSVSFGASSLLRTGNDITIISFGYSNYLAERAAEILSREQIESEIISLQTLNPLDMDTIFSSIKKTGRAVMVEEEMLRGGILGEIVARITETLQGQDIRIQRVAAKNVPLPVQRKHLNLILPTANDIVRACRELYASKH